MKMNTKQLKKLLGKNSQVMSFCSIHGPYNADNLCPCYDKDGKKDGYGYLESPVDHIDMGGAGQNN